MTRSAAGETISFSEEDLIAFSKASGDRNPLHLSFEYARLTPYGQPVVFGCLGAMACLGRLPASTVTGLEAQFFRPMFVGVDYRLETSQTDENWRAQLFDGSIPVVSLVVKSGPPRTEPGPEPMPGEALFERHEAAVRSQADITPGLEISGRYACDPGARAAVMERWGIRDRWLATVLSWSSYLVGMELPGESALFSKLVLGFVETALRPASIAYRASVCSVDSRLGRLRMELSLSDGSGALASGECWSFIRPTLPEDDGPIDFPDVNPDGLKGRVVVLTGASRGLGAALRRALEQRGAIVYSLARSAAPGNGARVVIGDAGDPEVLEGLRQRVLGEQGRLDFLISNASPPILPLRLEPNAAGRIRDYIGLAVSITLIPLCALLEVLDSSGGCAVLISSSAVEQPVREWPHYVAAKQAQEMLTRVAALQFPHIRTLIVRPEKLITGLTNTPMGRLGATPAPLFANRIAARLENPIEPGQTEIFS